VAVDRLDVDHLVAVLWVGIAVAVLAGRAVAANVSRTLRCSFALFALAVSATVSLYLRSPDIRVLTLLAATLLVSPWLADASQTRRLAAFVLSVSTVFAVGMNAGIAWADGQLRWTSYLASLPSNEQLAPPGVRWVAGRLRDEGATCVLDLSNSGEINGLVQLPTCTPYGYLSWVSASRQRELREAVLRTHPSVIVWSSDSGWYAIDGKPMTDRLPRFTNWLKSEYPIQECGMGYCLRLKSPTER
jgi:hypothetical protein